MNEVILCKYGEVILKGANKSQFEVKLLKELRRRASHIGPFRIYKAQSTVFIEPEDECGSFEFDEMFAQAKKVFGFVGVCRAATAQKNIEDIKRVCAEYLPQKLRGYSTFKAQAKRSDKAFPLKSPEIAREAGGAVLGAMPHMKVDLTSPEITVQVEVREKAAYIHAGQESGAGGIPSGVGGDRGLLLLSGGIDSPVAGYMMAKRGLNIEALHFESFPYTSEAAKEKVMTLAKELCEYCGLIRVHVISLTHIQEVLRDTCEEDYFTLLLRRFMMKFAARQAKESEAKVLITGESLGQVASQTLNALCVTDNAAGIPVFRPCIGMDKEEIITLARKIGTFDTSILPYEDCCTVFTPRHPRTRPELEKVLAQEALVDFETLIEEAWQTKYTVVKRQFDEPAKWHIDA